jgi:hypothetical protein
MKTPWKIQVHWKGETKTLFATVSSLKKSSNSEKLLLEDGSEWPLQDVISINGVAF